MRWEPHNLELMPLPQIDRPSKAGKRSSRLRHRQVSRMRVWQLASNMISALNALHTPHRQPQARTNRDCDSTELKLAWCSVHRRLLSNAQSLHAARRRFPSTGVRAVASLLRLTRRGLYSLRTGESPHVPMRPLDMDEPSCDQMVHMLDALPASEARFYSDEDGVVDYVGKSFQVFQEIESRYGFVSGTEGDYAAYFQRPDLPTNMWTWTSSSRVRAVMGFSTVPKKDPSRLRKLLMGCATNYMWSDVRERSQLGMLGGAALSQAFVPGGSWHLSAFDESNAFTFVMVPEWMFFWQAAPPLKASMVWNLLSDELKDEIGREGMAYPLYMRLPMGLSHSVHILMSINTAAVGRAIYASTTLEILDPIDLLLNEIEMEGETGHGDGRDDSTGLRAARRGKAQFSPSQWRETCYRLKRLHFRVFTLVHLFGGRLREGDVHYYVMALQIKFCVSVVMLSVDLAVDADWDLAHPPTAVMMQETAEQGLVDGSLGGPPCSTVSRARFNTKVKGPRPLRHRGQYVWGLPGLLPHEQARVVEANTLFVNTVSYFEAISLQDGVHLLEHPADPGEYPFPSFFDTDLLRGVEERTCSIRVTFDQCCYGQAARKRTTVSGTVDDMKSLRCECPGRSATHWHGPSQGRNRRGEFYTKALECYPADLCLAFARCFLVAFARMKRDNTGPGGHLRKGFRKPRATCFSAKNKPGGAVTCLNEVAATGTPALIDDNSAGSYMHVDDGIFISTARQSQSVHSDKLMHHCVDDLKALGFEVTDVREHGCTEKVVGYTPHPRKATLSLPEEKQALLHSSMSALLDAQYVPVDLISGVLGVWIWGALLNRDLLAIPCHVFEFVQYYQHKGCVAWWPSVKKEWIMMRDMLPYMKVDLSLPLANTIFASDAQGAGEVLGDHGGFGVVVTTVAQQVARDVFLTGAAPRKTVVSLDGNVDRIRHPERELRRVCPQTSVPQSFLAAASWQDLSSGRWAFTDHITLGEGRAVVKVLQSIAPHPHSHNHRVISLEDNMPVSCAHSKGRSSSYPLNAIMRRKSSYTLACNIRLILPWVDTKSMPADHLSRLVDAPFVP